MVISDVKMSELSRFGTIHCTAGNNWGSVSVEVELREVASLPAIIEPTYRSVRAIGGKQLMIPCAAVGIPTPRISWLLPNFNTLHRSVLLYDASKGVINFVNALASSLLILIRSIKMET